MKVPVEKAPVIPVTPTSNAWLLLQALMLCPAEITDNKHRVQAIKDLVKQLPRPNHDTMQALFKHLRK